jgi:hypothetical protein
MPNTINHDGLLRFINRVYNPVIADTQPVSVLALQLFGLGMR